MKYSNVSVMRNKFRSAPRVRGIQDSIRIPVLGIRHHPGDMLVQKPIKPGLRYYGETSSGCELVCSEPILVVVSVIGGINRSLSGQTAPHIVKYPLLPGAIHDLRRGHIIPQKCDSLRLAEIDWICEREIGSDQRNR